MLTGRRSRRRVLTAAALAFAGLDLAACVSYAGASADVGSRTASRVVQMSYAAPGGLAAAGSQPVLTSPGATQLARSRENQVRVRVADASGWPVAVDVQYQPRGGSGTVGEVFCGASPTLAIAAGSAVRVTPVAGSCRDGSASLPTSGSISFVFFRPLPPPPPPTIAPEQRWAVLVGIQDYAGNTHPTYGGRGDVSAARTALLHSGWRSDHILTLIDGQASGNSILGAMSWLADRSGPDTFSLFHFSGHVCIASRGPCAPGHTYLWSQDNQFIAESTVGSVLGRVQGRAWFDFAGCESGAFDAGLHSAKRLVTGSSQASETSYEQPQWNESVWAGLVWDQGFLQGRAGAKPDAATIGQMVEFGRSQAPRVTADQAAGPQHPYVAGGDPTQSLYAPRV